MAISPLILRRIDEILPSTEFVGGIFPRRYVSIIASKAGVGKTWYLLKLLTDLSKGGTIFNNQAYFEPPRKCLLFAGEAGIQLLTERQRKMHDKANSENLVIIDKQQSYREKISLDLDADGTKQNLLEIMNIVQPDIIVFDTLMSFMNSDESDTVATANIMEMLQRLAEFRNAAVIVTHHLRKSSNNGGNEKPSQDSIIGSSKIVRYCGTAWILQKTAYLSLEPVKTWWDNQQSVKYELVKENGEIYFNEYRNTYDDFNATEVRLEIEKYLKQLPKNAKITVLEVARRYKISREFARAIIEKQLTCIEHGTGGKPNIYANI